jgi:hypothetical protein
VVPLAAGEDAGALVAGLDGAVPGVAGALGATEELDEGLAGAGLGEPDPAGCLRLPGATE